MFLIEGIFVMEHERAAKTEHDQGEAEIDALLAEHNGDARAAIRALLHDLEVLARDAEAVSWGYVRARPSRALRAG